MNFHWKIIALEIILKISGTWEVLSFSRNCRLLIFFWISTTKLSLSFWSLNTIYLSNISLTFCLIRVIKHNWISSSENILTSHLVFQMIHAKIAKLSSALSILYHMTVRGSCWKNLSISAWDASKLSLIINSSFFRLPKKSAYISWISRVWLSLFLASPTEKNKKKEQHKDQQVAG